MKKSTWLLIISLLLITISCYPLFQMVREYWIDAQISKRYEISHVFQDEQGWERIFDVQELTVDDIHIKIEEEPTGKMAPLTPWDIDEGVPPGEIVKIHWLINGAAVSTPDEIWLSNRDRGSRYYSWLDVVQAVDKQTGERQLFLVQRVTDDDEPMNNRAWKIITISADHSVTEEMLTYLQRSENPLAVKLVNFSGTSLMSMGYYSDITHLYPTLFFPFLYPVVTGLTGVLLLMIYSAMWLYRKKR